MASWSFHLSTWHDNEHDRPYHSCELGVRDFDRKSGVEAPDQNPSRRDFAGMWLGVEKILPLAGKGVQPETVVTVRTPTGRCEKHLY
jgi:hypothetical protein